MSLLHVRDVSVSFGGVQALDHVTFELNRGEILGLIGPNGAGKTTLFNCISGVIRPSSGDIRFRDRSILHLRPHERARRGIARTFQNLQLWPSMTVMENLKLPMDAIGRRNMLSDALQTPFAIYRERVATERARAVLHSLDLLDFAGTLAGDLPVGVQRRVEIARALCLQPKLLLLDEPGAGLDAEETLKLADLLLRARDRFGVSMLLVDHDMSLVMRACQYIYVLDFGKMLASGKPDAIRNDPKVIAAYLGEPADEAGGTAVEAAGSPAPERSAPRPLLEVHGVAAGYGHLEVIRNVNLTVGEGEVVAVIGANGAGKTTTLRAITGLIQPARGRVTFAGRDVTGKAPQAIVRLGMMHVPQGRGLFPKLSVEETLRLAAYSAGRAVDLDPAYATFPVLGKRRRQLVGTLSGGEQQMVAMARALLVKPRLLLIDEMSQGLAPTVVQRLFKHIATFKEHGIAVLLVEQFVDSALSVADRAYVFEQGSVAREATAADLRRDQDALASAYLGSAAAEPLPAEPAAVGADAEARADLMADMTLSLPAEVKRTLEEMARKQGRPASELILELVSGSGKEGES